MTQKNELLYTQIQPCIAFTCFGALCTLPSRNSTPKYKHVKKGIHIILQYTSS